MQLGTMRWQVPCSASLTGLRIPRCHELWVEESEKEREGEGGSDPPFHGTGFLVLR